MFLSVVCQNWDLPENIALVPVAGEVVNWGLSHKPRKMVTLQWLNWVLSCNLPIPDLCTCPSLLGLSHRVFKVGLRYL